MVTPERILPNLLFEIYEEGIFSDEGVILARRGAKRKMAPRVGLEPTTCRLTAGRSTN